MILSFFYGKKGRKRTFLRENLRKIKPQKPEDKSIGQQFIENVGIKTVFSIRTDGIFTSSGQTFCFVKTKHLSRQDELTKVFVENSAKKRPRALKYPRSYIKNQSKKLRGASQLFWRIRHPASCAFFCPDGTKCDFFWWRLQKLLRQCRFP